jgi:O-acetyl-ADP-ribose deacetylase (regulator of RNase III)
MGEIQVVRGDITQLDVDAIVNAANTVPSCSQPAGRCPK